MEAEKEDAEEKKYSGYTTGRPPTFAAPEEMQEAITRYFQEGVKKRTVLIGPANKRIKVEVEVPTITGLCFFIGFESRQSFYDYEDKADFSYTVKRARLFIEKEYEEQLQTGNTTGAIFALKNFGWKDKAEVDHTSGGRPIQDTKHEIVFKRYGVK